MLFSYSVLAVRLLSELLNDSHVNLVLICIDYWDIVSLFKEFRY